MKSLLTIWLRALPFDRFDPLPPPMSDLAKRLGVEISRSKDPISLESLKGSRLLYQNSIFNTNWSCRGASALKMRPKFGVNAIRFGASKLG